MADQNGQCPGCDQPGPLGQACSERACAKRSYHYIPVDYWERAHKGGAQPDPTLGLLIGDYLVVAPIGSGGFGKVFLALQSPIFRLRGALKLLEFPSDNAVLVQALLEKFQGEAEALADLSHPNIVKLLKYGVHAQVPYLVMEFVDEAHTVRQEIQVRAREGRGFSHKELRSLFDQILNGLEAAHAQNIIHRDVKPENIMLQRVVGNPMHVKILDFGTAKFVENRADTKWPLGSPSYMAPEQVNLKGIGPWSDLYAVGVMLFELLTGRRPFPGETENEIVAYKLRDDFDPLAVLKNFDFPDEVETFLRKCLAKSPEDRFRSASELRQELHIVFDKLEGYEGTLGESVELTGLLDTGDLAHMMEAPTREADSVQNPPPPPAAQKEAKTPEAAKPKRGLKIATGLGVGLIGVMAAFWAIDAQDGVEAPVAEKAPAKEVAVLPPAEPVTLPTPSIEPDLVDSQDDTEAQRLVLEGRIQGVSAGKFHTCVLLDGKVKCWGANFDGELGIGSNTSFGAEQTADKAPFVELDEPANKVSVAGDRNASSSCVVLESGAIRCWGSNRFGQLGLGHQESVGRENKVLDVPPVDLGKKVLTLSASASQYGSHACALLEGGSVKCWGANRYGQLGLAHTTTIGDDESPRTVPDLVLGQPAKKVIVGKYHSCAILEDDSLMCWGWNDKGQLGYGHKDSIGDDETPVSAGTVKLDGKVIDIALGRLHTCALLEGGQVRCWGWNSKGQLGLGTTDDLGDDEPILSANPLELGAKVVQLTAGDNHTCALLEGGSVRCFGENNFGQLGYSHTRNIGDDEPPTSVGDVYLGEKALYIAAGSYHNCAVLESDTLKCWGHNKFGQLGYGHTDDIGDDETPVGAGVVPIE